MLYTAIFSGVLLLTWLPGFWPEYKVIGGVGVSYFECSRTIKHHLPLNPFPQCKEMGYELNVKVPYVIYDIQCSVLSVIFPNMVSVILGSCYHADVCSCW